MVITRGQRMGVRPPKNRPNRGYPLINQTLVTVTGLFITITPGMTHKV